MAVVVGRFETGTVRTVIHGPLLELPVSAGGGSHFVRVSRRGHLEGTPVSATLGQYDVFAGQVWIVVAIALLVSPLLFGAVLAN